MCVCREIETREKERERAREWNRERKRKREREKKEKTGIFCFTERTTETVKYIVTTLPKKAMQSLAVLILVLLCASRVH